MRSLHCAILAGSLFIPALAQAYIEIPYTLGKVVQDSQQIMLLEVTRVNKEKGLVLFKKIGDLKGKSAEAEFKHNIGTRGFHEREWKGVLAWAEAGKRAVFFREGDASETCINGYWYQCYREGEWWGMSHAEPFLLRTYFGEPDHLAAMIVQMLKGEEVIVPCLENGNRDQLQLRKGKLQRLRASLKRLEYNAKRDFVGWGADGLVQEYKTLPILKEGAPGWRYAKAADVKDQDWTKPEFVDSAWKTGKAPLGYGETELAARKGTVIAERGQDVLFRLVVDVPLEALSRKDATFAVNIASDNGAQVFWNGEPIDDDSGEDHEFAYWNREIELPRSKLKPGPNVLAARVKNASGSSDLYLDAELVSQWAVPAAKPSAGLVAATAANSSTSAASTLPVSPLKRDPNSLQIDKGAGTITLACRIAPRKLPHLTESYPIEVIATHPYPHGQKAHETVVVFEGQKPSELHAALVQLDLKPGSPALGEKAQAQGPEVKVWLEFTAGGQAQKLPLEKCLVPRADGKPLPPLQWFFTGLAMKQPDPEKDELVYGADLTGTLLTLFPVTDSCVLQTQLTMQDEPLYKLDTATGVLPPAGTAVKLVIGRK